MENLVLFAATTLVYLGVWCWVVKRPDGLVEYAKRTAVMALLCAPFNINGRVFTILGNSVSERGNFAVCSLYQKARGNALSIFGPFNFQSAGRDAVTIIGLSGYQSARQNALTFIGLSGYQSAGRDAKTFIGLAIYQRAGEKTRAFGAFSKLSAK